AGCAFADVEPWLNERGDVDQGYHVLCVRRCAEVRQPVISASSVDQDEQTTNARSPHSSTLSTPSPSIEFEDFLHLDFYRGGTTLQPKAT
ncbi:unnamed protein product, partial [Amoebophrya sp. A120]